MSNKAETVTEQASDNQGLVPKLRFPEFRDAGEWNFKPLNALAKRKTKRNVDESVVRVLTNSAEHGVIDQRDYFEKDIAVQGNLESYFVVALGDYVYNPRISVTAPVGPIGKNKIGLGVMSPLYTVFGFNCEDEFYEHFFRSSLWHPYMRFVSNSGARHDRMAVSADDFMAMPVPAPFPAEQQKIAECLSSLDALIAAETDKLAALRDHQKGLMQQLFPAEGETIPCLRFPEFCHAGEWKEAPLAKFIEEFREKSTIQDEFPVMTSARSGLVRQRDYYENDRITERDNVGFNIVPPEYITYRSRSDDRKFYFNENDLKTTGIVSIYYPVFRVLNGSNKFFIELLSAFSKVVGKFSVGTSQTVLSLNQLGRVRLPVPGVLEQRRIAAFLSSLDSLINAQSDKVDALKAHRSGLMQQLFPSSAGVTA